MKKEIDEARERLNGIKKAASEGRKLHIANRPKNSRLSKDKLEQNGFDKLPNWKDAVDRFKNEWKI